MSNLSLYTAKRFPEFVADQKPKIIEFIKAHYKALESPFYPLDLVSNLLEYYNINNSYFRDLVESISLVSFSGDVITVKTTRGFPDKGFLKINDELIRYDKRTDTTFENITRATSAIIKVSNDFVFTDSTIATHTAGDIIYNVAYDFAFYFYRRIKYEILNDFPLALNENINLSTLLKTVKSYYLSKGTFIADKLFFKILFNDQILDVSLKEYGSGASFSFSLSGTGIDTVTVDNGGSGYSNTVDLVSTGNGYGAVFDVAVTNGVITSVTVLNPGANYDINTVFSARQRSFSLGDVVYGEFGGVGEIARANEENISIYIKNNNFSYEELIYTDTVENVVDKFSSKDVVPVKKYPINNTIKTSDATVVSYDYLTVSNVSGQDTLNSIRNSQLANYTVCGNTYEILYDNVIRVVNPLGKVTYNISATNVDKIYPCNITKVLKVVNDIVVVDNAAGFPLTSGYFIANNNEYFYSFRGSNQFYGVTKVGHNVDLVPHDLIQFYAYDVGGVKITNTLSIDGEEYLVEPKFNQTNVVTSGGGFYQDSRFLIKDNRTNSLNAFTDNWRVNESYNTLASLNHTDVFCDITGVYEQEDEVYVTFNQIPYRSDIDFNSLGAYDQNNIKRIPKRQRILDSNSQNTKAIGVLLDGTQIQSFRGKTLPYGKYKEIKILDSGDLYPLVENGGTVVNPALSIEFSNGNYIYLEDQVKVFGSLKSVSILNVAANDLTGFIKKPTYTITNAVGDNGSGIELEFKLEYTYEDDRVTNIKILGVIVTNGGSNYTKKPTITIGGGGKLSTFNVPLDDIEISGELRLLDGSLTKDYSNIDLTTATLASSTEPDSSLNSFESVINPTIEYGSGAEIRVIIEEGSITNVIIDNGGQNYIKEPTLIVTGVGSGAILTPVLTNGVITGVTIVNGGNNYSITPTVDVVTEGSGFKTASSITEWTYNIPAIITEDAYGGFVFDPSISEHNLSMNKRVLANQQIQPGYLQVSYNHTATNNNYWGHTAGSHSKLIGWAYDGTPIYSAYRAYEYGLNNSVLTSSPLTSSYALKGSPENFRPSTGTVAFGGFVEDYEYVYGSGDLDEYNGRFSVTPEFPEGKYCYFATDAFPYFCGFDLKYTIDPYNIFPYSSIEDLPNELLRVHYNEVRYPYQKNNLGNSNVRIESIHSGSIEEVFIEVAGIDYSLEDKILIDNTNTNGTGFSCRISKITGVGVDSFSYNAPTNELTVTTTANHLLSINDKVYITEEIINNAISGSTTITISSGSTDVSVVNGINYRFVVDASYVDTGNDFYHIVLSQDSLGINLLYEDGYTFNERNIEINTSVLPVIFYAIVFKSDGTITKRIKISKENFDIYGEKTLTAVTADTFTYVINDLAETYSSIFSISDYSVTYTTGAYTGPINGIEILSGGFGYKDTPILSVITSTGDGASLNCYGSTIGKIKNAIVNKNTSFCLGYKQDYYETYTYYSGKIKGNLELFDVNLESPFILDGANPTVRIAGTGQELAVTFSTDGNYYFDIELNETLFPLDSERSLEVIYQSSSEFNGNQTSFAINDTDDTPITSPTNTNTLVFRNGAFQSETEYSFNGNEIDFSPSAPIAGEDIFIFNLNGDDFQLLNYSFSDNGSTYHFDVSSNVVDFSNAENRMLIFLEGVLQSKSLWTWDNINEYIVFNQSYEYTSPITVEIRLLPNQYGFFTTADNSLQTNGSGNYTYTGIVSDDFSDIIVSYNGVVQRYDSQFIRTNDAIEIVDDPGTSSEVFVYALGGDWRYCNLVVSANFTLFDVIPSYRRLSIPDDRKLYLSTGEELFIVEDRVNGNLVFYSEDDVSSLIDSENTLQINNGTNFGTLYNVKPAVVNTFVDAKIDKSIITQRTKVSDRFSRLESNYYNQYTIDVKFTRNPSEWKDSYKILNKPVGIKAYYTRDLECYESINKNDRSTSLLTVT